MAKNNPIVSFIVPVYNAEAFLQRCIDSILQQKFSNFELILVDDGSNDRSLGICYSYDDPRILVIHHNTNLGVSQARNSGLVVAKGEWVAFVDADDMVSSDLLSSFFNYNGNADLITHPVTMIEKDKGIRVVTFESIGKTVEQNIIELYENHLLGFVWSMFLRREIIEKNKLRFDTRLQSGEDIEFMSRYSMFVSSIYSFNVGSYIYTFPISNKRYGKIRNVYFLIYKNMHRRFISRDIRERFTVMIVPNLIQFIIKAYAWGNTEAANTCINYYRQNIETSFFLRVGSKIGFVGNLLIKFNARWLLRLLSPVVYDTSHDIGLEYIEL